MTEYQKKKMIDLTLVIIGIVLVGLFLRTQLSNPIIIKTDEETNKPLGEYAVGSNLEDEEDVQLPDFIDLKATSILINPDYIDILITLRGIPETVPLNSNEYSWTVSFDVNGDGEAYDDVIITHELTKSANLAILEASIDEEGVFETTIKQMDGDTESLLGAGESVVDGNTLYIRIPNSSKLEISEETPYHIAVNSIFDQVSYKDEMPMHSGE